MTLPLRFFLPVLVVTCLVSFLAGRASVAGSAGGATVQTKVLGGPVGDQRRSALGDSPAAAKSGDLAHEDQAAVARRLAMFRNGTESERDEAGMWLADYFARKDPEGGIEWLGSIGPLEQSAGVAFAMAHNLARRDKRRFLEMLTRLVGTRNYEPFLDGGLRPIGARDFDEAWLLVQEHSRLAKHPVAFRKAAFLNLAQANGEGAAAGVDFANSPESALEFFSRAVFKDQRLAVLALGKISDPATLDQAMISYSRGCAADTAATFGEALSASSMDPVIRDRGVASIVGQVYSSNLPAAIRLVKTIGNESIRLKLEQQMVDYADRQNPGAGTEVRKALGQ